MTININELRRLTQAATLGGWYIKRGNHIYGCKEVTDGKEKWHPVIACTDDDEVNVNFEANAAFIAAANPAVINELLDRLEESESDCLEQARLNGMGSSREAALMAKLKAAEKSDAESIAMYRKARDERDALRAEIAALVDDMNLLRDNNTSLRAKIAEMERQEPVATVIKEGDSRYWMSERLWTFPDGKYPLYALPAHKEKKNDCRQAPNCCLSEGMQRDQHAEPRGQRALPGTRTTVQRRAART